MSYDGENNEEQLLDLRELHDRRGELTKLERLVAQYVPPDKFPYLREYVGSLVAMTDGEIRRCVKQQNEARYEVSVAYAAEALGISESAVRKWDVQGCPSDKNYPGRFSSAIFYQWAVTYQSKKRFSREAKKRAFGNNAL